MLLRDDILSLRVPQPDPSPGSLLIAGPLLDQECFCRSTICLIDHDNGSGTMGLVTNRESGCSLADLVDGVEREERVPVFVGGPVQTGRLYYLHRMGGLIDGSEPVAPGLWAGGDFGKVLELVNGGVKIEGNIRFFVGYSGWSAGQLRGELDRYDWAVGPMGDPGSLLTLTEREAWRAAVMSLGSRYRVWLNFPLDAQLN